MDVSKGILILIIANGVAIFRFIVFSNFNKLKIGIGLVAINLALIVGYSFYKNNDIEFSDSNITILVILGISVLFSIFYFIEKRR